MDGTYEWSKDEGETDFYQDVESLIKKNPWAWQSVCAVLGLAGGVISPFLGGASDIISWFVSSTTVNSYLHVLSIVFCALTIPLLVLGACCLDVLEAKTARLSPPAPPYNESTPATVIRHDARQNAKHRANGIGALTALILLLLALPAPTYAQQTVFNVPTTDVLDQGKVYFELDISAKPNEPRFSSFVPRMVVGAGGRVEVGLNVTGNIQPGADATTLVPAVKWKAYDGGDNGWAVAVGNNLFIPLRNKSYDLGTYSYGMVQKTFKTKTRVGAGGYFFSKNVVAVDANRAGGQFTFEQPLSKKATLAADWLTGRHGAGYFTPGVIYKISPKVTGYASYSIGNLNPTRGNHFFLIEVGYNFN
jgi:hypothetical protein